MLVQSNLGGQGGRCARISYVDAGSTVSVDWNSLCEEPQPGSCPLASGTPCPTWASALPGNFASRPDTSSSQPGNEHILFRGVGTTFDTGDEIWLRITNQTAYRANNPRHNGVKRQSEGMLVGFFGAINLLGPRDPLQRPYSKYWSDQFTSTLSRACMPPAHATPARPRALPPSHIS